MCRGGNYGQMELIIMKIVLKGRSCSSGKAEGEALVFNQPIGWLHNIDFETGIVKEPSHELVGKYVNDKILVYPKGQGSSSPWGLYVLTKIACKGPKAIINQEGDGPTIHCAILLDLPMIHRFTRNPLEIIETGDYVIVNADEGKVEVTKQRR